MTRELAWNIATRHGIDLNADFHRLNSDAVESILEAAREYGYRAPKNANGSKARYFHAFLVRAYGKPRD